MMAALASTAAVAQGAYQGQLRGDGPGRSRTQGVPHARLSVPS